MPPAGSPSSSASRALSTSQLESSLRRSQTLARSHTNASAKAQTASMHQTQRLLKVLQSHPITRPDTHQHLALTAPPAPFTSSTARSLSPQPAAQRRDDHDLLAGFRRELERVRRDVDAWSHSERVLEDRQQQRMAELNATAPPHNLYDSSRAASVPPKPSATLMSTLSNLIHSPPRLAANSTAFMPRDHERDLDSRRGSTLSHFSDRLNLSNITAAHSHGPSPFASVPNSPRRTATAVVHSSPDPHVQSLAAVGSSLLDSHSASLDASHARLQSLLNRLHAWKETRAIELKQTLADLEAKHSQQMRALIEQFEADRARLETASLDAKEQARRAHARAIDEHVHELNQAVEREFRQHGGISERFAPPTALASFGRISPTRRPRSAERLAALDRTMRLEHLDQNGIKRPTSAVDHSSDDEHRESVRAAERRKRLQYASALNGSSTRSALAQSQSASNLSSSSGRRTTTVAELLYSSSEDEALDEATTKKQELIAQANYLKHAARSSQQRPFGAISNSADLAISYGVLGSRRRRDKSKPSARAQRDEARTRTDARVLLETSSDEETEAPAPEDPYTRARMANSVRFAPSPTSAPAPTVTPHRRPRTEKDEAAAVFHDTTTDDEEDDQRRRVLASALRSSVVTSGEASAVAAASAPGSFSNGSGRLHATPSKVAAQQQLQREAVTSVGALSHPPPLKDLARTFQQRVERMNHATASVHA